MNKKILLIDNDTGIRFTFDKFLSSAAYDLYTAEDFDEGIKYITEMELDVIFIDPVLQGHAGLDIIRQIRELDSKCPIIIITGYPSINSATEAIRMGAMDYIPKPINKETLFHTIDAALQHKNVMDEMKNIHYGQWQCPLKVLVLVAHPDDEVLGCGGLIAYLTGQHSEVSVVFTTDGIRHAPISTDSRDDAYDALKELGVKQENIHFLGIKTQRSDEYALRDYTPLVEQLGASTDLVITTSEHDLNIDHVFAYKLALTCFRPINKRTKIISMEILSSSEWAAHSFQPNYYFDISDTIDPKIAALKQYEKQILPFPNPRSPEAIRVKSQQRGLEAGFNYAEAYHIIRWF